MEKKYYSLMIFRRVLRFEVRDKRLEDYQNLLVNTPRRLYNYKLL